MISSQNTRRSLLTGSALAALSLAAVATPAMAVVPNENTNSEEIVDTDDQFRGVGMFYRADGFVCSGTLINPRTVLFAAHCVNDVPEEVYNVDGIPAAWSFNVDAFPGFVNWFGNNFASNPELGVFNVNRIFWDARSTQDAFGLGFLEADIALASLDTPAAGIPTWALLFTTLPAPETSDPVLGTGYHVNIVGYGGTGNAVQGPVEGIDFRRRAAENMLGGFFSLDDQDNYLFGPGDPTFPQNLYQLDFDSQDRSFFRDINIHRDDALPNEGTTAGGDSGGPLILDAANNTLSTEDLVIGVLSGGSRIFGGTQPFGSLGTTSFYQPLSLYWQYIVENNPYRYVSAKAGNGNWEDANHWQTDLDPMYRIINSAGQVVNGLPTTPELGPNGTDGKFGSFCVEFEEPGDECFNIATGEIEETFTPPEGGNQPATAGGELTSGRARVSLDAIAGGAEITALPGEVAALDAALGSPTATRADRASNLQAQAGEATLPTPTLANGLPGATGFVPDNIDAVTTAEVRVDPRYYDVTLSRDGTTTLSSEVTIDRLTVRGNAGLTVAAAGDLTSLIDINQFGGRVNVNGGLTSVGDYTLFAGMLEGTGTVTAPFLTSITGVFSPGTMGTIGTLTIDGNLVMSSGTQFNVDLGAGATSDRLAVTGIANVGGIVNLGMGVTQRVNGNGQTYTIVTGTEGVSGTFTERQLSAILSQNFIYQDNAVLMEIEAANYSSVIDPNNPVQDAYAQLFDQNRPNAALADLYALDFASAETIRSTFDGLAPVNEQAVRSISQMSVSLLQNFNDARMREADKSRAGGKIAVTGRPLDLAQMSLAPVGAPLGGALMSMQDGGETEMTESSLPENVGIFLSGGYVSGEADSLPGFAQETDITGLFIAGGIEFYPGENTMVGLSGYYNDLEADTPLGQRVDSQTYAASLYLRHAFTDGPVLDAQFSMGSLGLDTTRTVQFLGATQSLTSTSDDRLISGALGLSYDITSGIGTISPGIEARYASVDLDTVRETGGTTALAVSRENYESKQARFGFDYENRGKGVSINGSAQLVWEFEDGPQLLGANFAQGVGPNANFVLDQGDHTWGEVGISATVGDGPLQFSVGADTTIGRTTADVQVYRGTMTYRF
ncbi:autotransporter domain-containing protein [Porphyrobacter sp. YT40]|uniref:autotransporter domain-containing protein n=1 Tax=Porphyrobacter sp. YT40 TaxID=2547601 RepID=UPI001141F559|nr:autotransporter domain-containing protein [Porphyrobacter sp. YT40]QDH35631.1 autotransporter domain-containing protein [Porphyrobacter sp. YT40]